MTDRASGANRPTVIALGFFDGVHLGHQALMARAVQRGRERDMDPAVFTFDRSPREFVTSLPVPLLTSAEDRRRLVEELFPIRRVFIAPFDQRMMTMPWQDFITDLRERYHAGWLVAGHDFRFGHKNQGNAALLAEECRRRGLGCDIIPPVRLDGITVSSTHIRSLLERGDLEAARRFLGHGFTLSGPVRRGRGLGSRLNAPTLNLVPDPHQLLPAYGVYAAYVTVDGGVYPAVTNIGVRPTVDGGGPVTVESHLLSGGGDFYGVLCRVELVSFLRRERRFASLEALSRQIAQDALQAEAVLGL